MARCSVATRASAIATTVRGPSLYATTGVRPVIREVGVFNTTTTGFVAGLVRATATGTQGAALTEVCDSDSSHTVIATAFNTHTADATVGAAMRQASIGAAVGAGVIWTFGDQGLIIDGAATTVGVVINCPTGTGQIFDFYIVWDE